MRPIATVAILFALAGFPRVAATTPSYSLQRVLAVGRRQTIEGFAVTVRSVERAREAGAADYVARRGDVFLLVSIDIRRVGAHGSYYANAQDFHVETARGAVVDSDGFGLTGELRTRRVYARPVDGVIGFEVPATDRGLRLLWQPAFDSSPDAQAAWAVGTVGETVSYYR